MTQPELQYRVNAQLRAVERTTSLASQRPKTAPALPYSVPDFKKKSVSYVRRAELQNLKKENFYRNLP
jgi:hypothetical protein